MITKLRLLFILLFLGVAVALLLFWLAPRPQPALNPPEQPRDLWPIRSVDTMKTSRDLARAKLLDRKFDQEIMSELTAIKSLGANYVAIDTPYDDEFLPYLERWVKLARQAGLKVWFRGNWCNWEGWFDYPKNLTPAQHQAKTATFIETHANLFADGDIFDPCPECENAGFWPQPDRNNEYNQFVRSQRVLLGTAFGKIDKKVSTNILSIIGGRAKEVLDQPTFAALDHLVTIDHYAKDPTSMSQYINYFSQKWQTKVLLGEFGAPNPDINGDMDEKQQARFIDQVLQQLYQNKANVLGINYNVLTIGTTKLLNNNGTERLAMEVLRNYFLPGQVGGAVTNTLGDRLSDIPVKTSDGLNSTTTDQQGYYALNLPAGTVELVIGGNKYKTSGQNMIIARGSELRQDAVLEPEKIGFVYRLRLFVQKWWPSQTYGRV